MNDSDREESGTFAVFALPEDYSHHIGQVASIGTDGLRVVRRQVSLSTPYRIEVVPLSDVSRVHYESKLAPMRIAAGVAVWAAAGLMGTWLRWKIEPEVVYGNEAALCPGVQG
jgi:hypothetical protein